MRVILDCENNHPGSDQVKRVDHVVPDCRSCVHSGVKKLLRDFGRESQALGHLISVNEKLVCGAGECQRENGSRLTRALVTKTELPKLLYRVVTRIQAIWRQLPECHAGPTIESVSDVDRANLAE